MDNKKRRSSLRKSLAVDMVPTDMKTQLKRRISFSGKNSVRVFHGEEEPKTWNNSYEISDHLNANETASNLCVLPKPTTLKSALKNKENKENVDQSYEMQKTIEQNQKYKNLSVSNNVSVLSTTKDLINISYQHQTSKMYQIENSVDITLYEKELKFQVAEDKSSDQTKSKLYSFSLEDNEKETRSVMFGEKTIDFMRSLQGDALNIVEDNRNPCDVTDNKGVTVFSEYMDEEQYIEIMNVKDKIQKEPITIYMNDSLSISDQEQISENKRKTLHDAPMQLSPNKAKQYNKENVIPPLQMENANETQNYSCQMEIEDDIFSEPQSNKVNVEKESVAFQEKLNRISFLQTSDDNMEIDRSPKVGNAESDVKSRQTINFNEAIEMSPKTSNFNYNKNKPHSRPTINFNQAIVISPNRDKTSSVSTQMKSSRSTINFNQPINMSPSRENKTPAAPVQNKSSRSTINFNQPINMSPSRENKTSVAPIQNKSSRSTINFNQPIDMSPNRDNKTSAVPVQNKSSRTTINFNKSIDFSPKNSENKNCLGIIKSRPTINFNQSMEIDSQNTAAGNPVQHGAIPKNKSRTTINFNQPIETSPLRTKNNLQRQTLLLKEDICESPKLSQEPARSNNLNVPDSVRKHGQVPKLIVRKICTPLVNKNKNLTDLDQQRMLRYKKKQEQMDPDKDKEIPTAIEERKKPTKADKSLNFSLSSVKNVSLSPESSSPLIPSEFKAYNLKQLNDEIERGKINVFSNAPKTPSTDRKLRFGAQSSQPTLMKQRRTLVFDDVDIPISSDDTFKTTKSNNYFDFNTTQEAQQNKKSNTKCRFSQADDIMLDNTSFLTRAKLGDETVSRNSSKREFTQLNDIMDVFNESLREAASKLGSSVKSKKSCTSKNDTLSSMFQNAKPIFTQTITTLKDMNLYDAMDISHDIESNGDKYEKDINNQNYHMRQTVLLDHDIDPCDNINENTKKNLNSQIDKNINNINFENNEMEIDNDQEHNIETHQKVSEKNTRQTIYLNSDIEEPHHLNDERTRDKTLYLDEVVNDDINHRTQANNKEATSNVASMCGRQTTYLNNDIEESLNSDALEKSNKKTDDLKENLVSDGEHNKESHGKESKQLCDDYNLSISIVDNGINDEQLHKRQQLQTLVYHQDIDHDMSIENQSKVTGKTSTEIKENTQYGRNICEDVSKNITRKTLFLDEEIPFENLLTEKEKNEDTENPSSISNRNTTRKTLYFNSEIPLEKSQIINEEYKSIEKNDRDIPKFNATRETTFFNNEIPLDDVEKNIQSVKAGVEIENCKQTRKTLYFNKEIAVENITEKIYGSIQNDNDNYKETRKTLYFNNEIDEEKAATRNKNDFQTDIQSYNITRKTLYYNNDIPEDINVQNSNLTRNTIQLNSDIPVEKVPAIIGSANQKDEINKSLENVNPYRKTEFYGNEICEFDESKCDNISKNLPKQVPQARKSVYIAQEMDVTLNETTTGIVENMNVSNNQQYDENKVESSTINVPKSRKSIYTTECMDLTLNVKEVEKEEEGIPHICQSKEIENDSMMNLSIPDENSIKNEEVPKKCKELSNCEDNKSSKETRKTLYFEHNNEMSLDQSFTPAENYEFPEPGEPLNAAKMTLSRHVSTNALSNKSKLPKKDENTFMTPLKFPGTNSNNYMTPRLSLLEFKAAERKILEEERLERNKYLSPIRNDNTNKRLPINITPVLSNPKKRHTLVFDDCLMDESNISLQADNDLKKDISCNEKPDLTEESKKQEPFRLSKGVTNDHAMEISGIVANDSVLQTPTKQRKSRIPIPISSGKKSNRSFSVLHTSDIHPKEDDDQLNTETEDQLNMEPDNLAESIQVMRRATTFLQRRDTEIGHKELDLNTETDPIKKSSIFEGNPITISDVSVFFEAQRKSNSVGPETEMTLALDKMNASGLNAIEKAKKSLENRYLNLTLEDIEKTRLSLVRISYEDGTINNTNASVQEQIDDCVANQDVPDDKNISNNDLEDKIELKNRRHSVNYLRNVSTVCRKCKRCQDTFLNETSSSASESFVLPPLPPLPDLGLERLRRLRKRPAIADVNILWQRVSLDRTIINALNISDDDSQIISDLDDEADDESSPVIQCIRKYEKDMLSFEMELLGKHPSKTSSIELPFVLRLDNLLSEKSTNWIFDFQMQSRGILLFTHKQMYTFAVSLTFNEIDPLGRDISLKSVSLEKGFVPEKNWKAIDFVLDFQFKLNLPFDLQSLCEGSNEAGIFKMLQTIDRVCLDTIKMGKQLQRICFTNQAAIIRDEFRTYARKIIRNIRNRTNSDFKCVEKTEIKVELLNIKKLSFRNIVSPPLHHFCEEIHLLPTGLQFLNEFLQKPINYIKHH